MELTKEQKKLENIQEPSSKSIWNLNDDCLIEIFSYLSLEELVEVDKVSPHFRGVADEYFYKKEKVLVIDADVQNQENIADLAERMGPFVTTLEIMGFLGLLESDHLKQFWINWTELEHLTIRCVTLTGHLERMKNIFKELKSLKLIYCVLTDEIGEYLKTSSTLESLSLEGCMKITGSFLPDLKHQLKEIDLRSCCKIFEGPYFEDFCRNNLKLESLAISFSYERPDGRQSIKNLAELKNMKGLKIHVFWSAPALEIIPDFPKLTRLELRGDSRNPREFYKLSDFLNKLAENDTLEYLSIFRTFFQPTFNVLLPKFTKLKVLRLSWIVDDDSHLKNINMECRRNLEFLEISRSGITNEDLLDFIKDCPNLKFLNLIYYCWKITDALIIGLLPILNERPHCLEIKVRDTRISKSIVEDLKLHENQKIKLKWTTD